MYHHGTEVQLKVHIRHGSFHSTDTEDKNTCRNTDQSHLEKFSCLDDSCMCSDAQRTFCIVFGKLDKVEYHTHHQRNKDNDDTADPTRPQVVPHLL
jgi:hypothetical protein